MAWIIRNRNGEIIGEFYTRLEASNVYEVRGGFDKGWELEWKEDPIDDEGQEDLEDVHD